MEGGEVDGGGDGVYFDGKGWGCVGGWDDGVCLYEVWLILSYFFCKN